MNLLKIIKKKELFRLRKYRIYLDLLREYIKRPAKTNIFQIWRMHKRGFLVSDWKIMGLNEGNYKNYLSSKQYNKSHPINGYYSKIIDDKMIIKYVLSGTELEKYTPDYFYMLDEEGYVCPLMNAPVAKESYGPEDILALLYEKKRLAIKLVAGSIGKGFYKGEIVENKIYINGEEKSGQQFCEFISSLRNYIISEYLVPHKYLAEFWPDTANALRYLLCRTNGELYMLKSFIRFGSKKTGFVENFNRGGVLCYIDENGTFDGGYIIHRASKVLESVHIENHPDTGKKLSGEIPCWSEIQNAAIGIAKLLPQIKYIGYDFVVTEDEKVKLLEINSLTSLDALQMDCSILDTDVGKTFFTSLKES